MLYVITHVFPHLYPRRMYYNQATSMSQKKLLENCLRSTMLWNTLPSITHFYPHLRTGRKNLETSQQDKLLNKCPVCDIYCSYNSFNYEIYANPILLDAQQQSPFQHYTSIFIVMLQCEYLMGPLNQFLHDGRFSENLATLDFICYIRY